MLQETTLGLAEFYRKFSKIYFPIRLDQRGRLYCSPAYLKYQSNELSKALVLFAYPGIINKNNLEIVILKHMELIVMAVWLLRDLLNIN